MTNLQAQTSNRAGLLWPVLAAAALCAGCISIERSASPDAADITRMGEEAVKVCGAGNVKEVTAKTFICK